eukprot:SAG25_NODE_12963_length_273_cov_0.597701_1_plen_29_part_10
MRGMMFPAGPSQRVTTEPLTVHAYFDSNL